MVADSQPRLSCGQTGMPARHNADNLAVPVLLSCQLSGLGLFTFDAISSRLPHMLSIIAYLGKGLSSVLSTPAVVIGPFSRTPVNVFSAIISHLDDLNDHVSLARTCSQWRLYYDKDLNFWPAACKAAGFGIPGKELRIESWEMLAAVVCVLLKRKGSAYGESIALTCLCNKLMK